MLKTVNMMRVLLKRSDKFALLLVSVLTTAAALWEVAGIGLLIPIVATVVNPELLEQNAYLKLFYQCSPWQEHRAFMIYTSLLLVGNFTAKTFYNMLVLWLQSQFVFRKQQDLGERLFRNYINSGYTFMLEHAPAELNARMQRVNVACEGTMLPVLLLASDFLVVLALLAALMFFMPWILTGAVAALLIFSLIFYYPFRKYNENLGRVFTQSDDEVSRIKLAAFAGIKTVKTTNSESFFERNFREQITAYSQVQARFYWLGQLPRLWLELLAVLLAMGIFGAMSVSGMAAGSIVLNFALLVAAMGRMLPALSRMHYNLNRLRQVNELFASLFEDLQNIKPECERPLAGDVEKLHLHQVLEITDVSFSYPDGRKVFEHFSCSFPAASSVALTGPTGGGKTTLADLITGLLKPNEGKITFDGQDIQSNLRGARSVIGYVPQQVFLFAGTIRENVAFGLDSSQIDEEKLQRVLRLAHLTDWVDTLPDKSYTVVEENGINLSGGQRQRLGIARALYREPELLILDEATSALDEASENAVVEALETLHGQMTMLVIAHRLSTIEHCDYRISVGN